MAAVVMRPTKAEQFDFLQLRHQLKDSSTTDDNKKKLPFDNFGFFFGLSEHVMAKKVSEEMKDFVPELKKLASRESRDYSFLQSDGAEIPKPSKGEHEEVGKSKSSSAKSESSSTKQCSTKPMPKQNKPVLKHSIKYRLKEERPEVVIGKARASLEKSESCSTKQGLKHRKQSVDPKCIAKPMPKLKKSVSRIRSKTRLLEPWIQKIFGCNRKLPRDDDDGDDRAMRKSAKIAKEEDERERLLLEKEEKQEEGLRATKKLKIKIKVSKN
ncbi:unnamed protein product [Malus baccata var. baccata]